MAQSGADFYDNEAVFAAYQARRQQIDTPNDTLEKPVILELIQPIHGKRILDLGCGDATIGRELLQLGAVSYLGLEGSRRMAEVASQTLAGTAGQLIQQHIEDWIYPAAAFDIVLARLALHYIADLATLATKICATLVPGGRLVFSVEHPVITSCDRGWPAGTLRQDWVVDDYFRTGLRETQWLGGSVQKYHRTIEEYVRLLLHAGFQLEQLREGQPDPALFQEPATYERRTRIPLFLILAARKPE